MRDNEIKRIESLRNLKILDSTPDSEFDDLVSLAAQICETPIALISLVDADRQWFKSKLGTQVAETSREHSFCSHAIEQSDVFIVSDATKDARFSSNPLVIADPQIRFYAGAPLFDENGLALGTLCVIDQRARSLTARQIQSLKILAKQVESLIQRQHLHRALEDANAVLHTHANHLNNLIENQDAGIVVEDRNRNVTFHNRKFFETLDLKAKDLRVVGKASHSSVLAEMELLADTNHYLMETARICSEARPVRAWKLELQNGCFVELDYAPLFNGEVLYGHMWMYRDVSERVRNELLIEYQRLKLLESQKLSALGEMAGGLAHEINNPLTIIFGRTHHLLELSDQGLPSIEQVREYADDVLNVTQRIMRIIKGLRSFARSGDSDPLEEVELAIVVNDTLEFCRRKIEEAGIELRLPVFDSDLKVHCRAVQISQIILNLLNNSFDAVSGTPNPWIEVDSFSVFNEVVLSVTDSGHGIDPTLHDSIFNPFFTTKKVTQGTGLGLSISQKIAREHGGNLQIDLNSKHTRFLLRLPSVK